MASILLFFTLLMSSRRYTDKSVSSISWNSCFFVLSSSWTDFIISQSIAFTVSDFSKSFSFFSMSSRELRSSDRSMRILSFSNHSYTSKTSSKKGCKWESIWGSMSLKYFCICLSSSRFIYFSDKRVIVIVWLWNWQSNIFSHNGHISQWE